MRARPLVLAWLALMALTLAAGAAADVAGQTRLGGLPLLLIAVATLAKARIILARYLQLGSLPGLLTGFSAVILVVLTIVTASMIATG